MPARVRPDPPGLPLVVSYDEALAAGMSRGEILHRLRSGRWVALHPGQFLRDPTIPPDLTSFERERLEHVRAAVGAAASRPGAVVSHTSAVLLHGLPLVSGLPAEVTLTDTNGRRAGLRSGVRTRSGELIGHDITFVDHEVLERCRGAVTLAGTGVGVTAVARTWADVARTQPLADSVAVGDHALHLGLVTVDQLEREVVRTRGLPGFRGAQQAVELLDGRRETALESLSWVRFVDWRVPLPLMQHTVRDRFGFVGRLDFLWEQQRIVGEADGRLKYVDPKSLWEEKRREDRLRALGFIVVRWGWSDLLGPRPRLRDILESALANAA